MKNIYKFIIIFCAFAVPAATMAQVTVNAAGRLTVEKGGDALALDGANPWMSFRDNGALDAWLYVDGAGFEVMNAQAGQMRLGTSGADRVWIMSDGDVGIGAEVINSSAQLEVHGGQIYNINTYPWLYLNSTATGNQGIYYQESGTTKATAWHDRANDIFRLTCGGSTANHLNILPSGNIGIGTTTPGATLHVVAGASDPIFEGSTPFIQIRGGTETENKGIVFQNGLTAQSYVYHNGGNGNLTLFNSGSSDLVVDPQGNVGIGTNSPAYKLQVSGNVDVTGELTAASDMRLKKDIEPVSSAMDIVNKLNPVTYNFDREAYPDLDLADRRKYGLLAQEVEAVLPNLVSEGAETTSIDGETIKVKSVNYMEMIPLLVKSIQELEAEVQDLKKQLNACKK